MYLKQQGKEDIKVLQTKTYDNVLIKGTYCEAFQIIQRQIREEKIPLVSYNAFTA